MAWPTNPRPAKSLVVLRDQVNAEWPSRSKVSDGMIGDEAHAATASDHNPNSSGVVCAFDITHDPAHGLDAHALADRLLTNRHPNLKYLISNSRIAGAWTGWKWAAYGGTNPHDKHIHVSVGVGEDGQSQPGTYDDTTAWKVTKGDNIVIPTKDLLNALFIAFRGRPASAEEVSLYVGKVTYNDFIPILNSGAERDSWFQTATIGRTAVINNWEKQLADLKKKLADASAGAQVLNPGLYKVN